MPPYHLKTISALHQLRGFPKPAHPLISIIDVGAIKHLPTLDSTMLVADFYMIALKRNFHDHVKAKYGQQAYDFNEGTMAFVAPGQVFNLEIDMSQVMNVSGWVLLIHPDFLWNTPLATKIKQYEYFSYSTAEALHLSEKEERTLDSVIQLITQEYQANLDAFSQDLILAQVETLLTFAERYYQRQFLTRKKVNHQLLSRMETLLTAYFDREDLSTTGLPSVQYVAEALHVSPTYLSTLLKVLTGRSTQHYIHDKLLEKAKLKLSTTSLSVSEIAYALGFEHPQSFSKLFKTKTSQSPLEFRASFN
ncbi:helix-turn-helix domain-containing protein [Spirosoma pollinicola]|uniref:AraC family transcriptional regulator n=1 Tax=Spirosoma pollinicola TaxID=2057025 RepID=A0A2K8YWW4_9BACT|nr:helix-turn-helix transcriptional regulator [Spirosoma pollinicola]AUD02130.1 AraC family transcriptional regulator [Spirosoma pollinicola]